MLEELTAGFPILSCILFLPIVGAAVLWLFDEEDMVRTSALTIALVELALSVFVLLRFVPESAAMQFTERVRWIPALGISYHLAVDGISVLFVGLTAFLTVLVVIYSWDTIRHQVKLYMMCLLALETTTMGVFVSLDLILFFVFWELMLIPSYFLIKLWGGGAERHYAALKFVLYTLLGSVFMLVGIALLNINYHQWASLHHTDQIYSFDLLELLTVPIPVSSATRHFLADVPRICVQGAGVSFPHMVARCAVGGPDRDGRGLGGFEIGDVRFYALQHSLAARCVEKRDGCHGRRRARALRDSLWSLDGVGSSRFSALAGLQQRQPSWLCRRRVVCLELSRSARQLAHDDQSGLQHGRALLYRRVSLLSAADDSVGGIRGDGETSASTGDLLFHYWAGVDRTSRHQWVCRRVSHSFGSIQSQMVVRCHRRSRGDFRRRIFSLVLRTFDVRTVGRGVKGTMHDLQPREKIIAVALSVMILWIGLYPSPFLRIMNGSVQALVERVQQETKVSLQDNRIGREY